MLETLKDLLGLLLSAANICVLGYAFYRFTRKPHDTLEERVIALEVKSKEHDEALRKGNDRFREQEDTNEVIIQSVMALIAYEVQYCITENKVLSSDLEKAKIDLNKHLARRRV